MPAARKFVRDSNGIEVHGLSFHKSSEPYYSIDEATGKRVHHGVQLNAAIKSFKHVDASLVAEIADLRKGILQGAKTQLEAALQWAPEEPQLQAALRSITTTADAPPPPLTQKLSDCFLDWEKWSKAQHQQKEDTKRHFDLFVKTVSDLSINHL